MAKKDDPIRRELGISRRELLKKSAIVGGTLLWATPVVQSLTPAASAQVLSPVCSCCCCNEPVPLPGGGSVQCFTDSFPSTACADFCAGAGGGPQPGTSGYCTGSTDCDDINNSCVCV